MAKTSYNSATHGEIIGSLQVGQWTQWSRDHNEMLFMVFIYEYIGWSGQ